MSNDDVKIIMPGIGSERGWRVFEKPEYVLIATSPGEVLPVLGEVERLVETGLQAAGFISYEAAGSLDKVLQTHVLKGFPLVWFGLFDGSRRFEFGSHGDFSVGFWDSSVSLDQYRHAIDCIKKYMVSGDTYQVNYTIRMRAGFHGDIVAFFRYLQSTQKTQYSAFIDTKDFAVCSVSPELFFALDGDRLVSRPMKGTARRGLTFNQDLARAAGLAGSEKDRAENVMIVDMVRNDMGRIAETGTVCVPRMFEVEKYPTVFQMTSTVECRSRARFGEIVKALFPCASITGAPKVRTMEIIKELEPEPRGLYTGCVGCLLPDRKAQFNVAIRTVVVDKRTNVAEYGVGGGIVWDSTGDREYDECRVKAAVLTTSVPCFCILETLLWERTDGYFLLKLHLDRMERSAEYFDYRFDRMRAEKALLGKAVSFCDGTYRVRLTLDATGSIEISADIIQKQPQRWNVKMADGPIDSKDIFLYHKTTNRVVYEKARQSGVDADDVILWNERAEVTESTIANIVVEKKGVLVTPSVSCGLLGGVFREWLLAKGEIEEGIITPDDLRKSGSVFLINSVRKWIPVGVV